MQPEGTAVVGEALPSGLQTMTSSIEFAHGYNTWILQGCGKYFGRRCLEVGTGQGNFKGYVAHRFKRFASLDIDEAVIRRAAARDPDGTYICQDIAAEGAPAALMPFEFDTVLCINVLEHVPDHEKAVENLLASIQPGGHLVLFVPAFNGLYNSLDRLAGHLRRYTLSMIRDLFRDRPARLVKNEYFNPVGGLGWWANKWLPHRDLDSQNVNRQVQVYERYLLPISKIINPLTRQFFGQSVLCIARKE